MMKRSVLMTAAASLALALLPSIAHAGDGASDKNSKARSASAVTTIAPGIKCRPTTAAGHQPPAITPPAIKPPFKNRIFTFTTNCGDIVVAADGQRAQLTVLALTALAKGGYFDQTLCHRLTTSGIYVLQCGDPTATGSGGPQFTYRDENLPTTSTNDYPAGIVAMANSGPNTNGSQFFFVYANTTLPPAYSRWGVIIKGLDIVKAIAAQGTANGSGDGAPKQTVAIERVSVR
jgi:peptidyl-prolyl cis-trans isomerase B (cyclophilin B)